jgi:hypothetical protein
MTPDMPEIPLCDCHGVPKRWRTDRGRGYWSCSVKYAESQSRYNKSAKGKARLRKYFRTEKGRECKKRSEAKTVRIGDMVLGYFSLGEVSDYGKAKRP